jgi:hypothetical protein
MDLNDYETDNVAEIEFITNAIMDNLAEHSLGLFGLFSKSTKKKPPSDPPKSTGNRTQPSVIDTDNKHKKKSSRDPSKSTGNKTQSSVIDTFNKHKDFEDLELNVLSSKPNPGKDKPRVCMVYVNNMIANVTSFREQVNEHISEFIVDKDNPNLAEMKYWLDELQELHKELEESINILNTLKNRVLGHSIKYYLQGINVMLKDEQQIRTSFETVKTKPDMETLQQWKKKFRSLKDHLQSMNKILKENPNLSLK